MSIKLKSSDKDAKSGKRSRFAPLIEEAKEDEEQTNNPTLKSLNRINQHDTVEGSETVIGPVIVGFVEDTLQRIEEFSKTLITLQTHLEKVTDDVWRLKRGKLGTGLKSSIKNIIEKESQYATVSEVIDDLKNLLASNKQQRTTYSINIISEPRTSISVPYLNQEAGTTSLATNLVQIANPANIQDEDRMTERRRTKRGSAGDVNDSSLTSRKDNHTELLEELTSSLDSEINTVQKDASFVIEGSRKVPLAAGTDKVYKKQLSEYNYLAGLVQQGSSEDNHSPELQRSKFSDDHRPEKQKKLLPISKMKLLRTKETREGTNPTSKKSHHIKLNSVSVSPPKIKFKYDNFIPHEEHHTASRETGMGKLEVPELDLMGSMRSKLNAGLFQKNLTQPEEVKASKAIHEEKEFSNPKPRIELPRIRIKSIKDVDHAEREDEYPKPKGKSVEAVKKRVVFKTEIGDEE